MNISITQILAIVITLLPAIIFHEVAHGYVAYRFGDNTAKMLGRLTANPIKHIDPIGSIVVPLAFYFAGGAILGWAKPVPINSRNFRDPIRDMRWVALAGPLSNLLMAFIWAAFGFIISTLGLIDNKFAVQVVFYGIWLNILLMVFNLIPILPSDGGRLLYSVLPWNLAMQYRRTEPFGMLIIAALLLLTPVFRWILDPFYQLSKNIFTLVTGLYI